MTLLSASLLLFIVLAIQIVLNGIPQLAGNP